MTLIQDLLEKPSILSAATKYTVMNRVVWREKTCALDRPDFLYSRLHTRGQVAILTIAL
jgi:hypothetical protein